MVKPETERYDCSIQTEAATEELLPMVAVLFPLVVRLISKTPDLEHAPKLQADSKLPCSESKSKQKATDRQ